MRAVLQRVSRASVAVEGAEIGSVGKGFLILLAVGESDTSEDGNWLAQKIASLRVFADEAGHMNLSARDAGGGALVISQFTLYASTRKGARPSFNGAARPETAIPLYEDFVRQLGEALGRPVATGRFGAMMAISLVNDGPVTILLDSRLKE